MNSLSLTSFLNKKVDQFNQPSFIKDDPISIPHQFSKKQDIEISGFFAAIFSWGNRTTIINKSNELLARMDNSPFDFINHHSVKDLKRLKGFKHRTFNDDDLFYFIDFFHRHYKKYDSLEEAFFPKQKMDIGQGLDHFKKYFFSAEHLKRTENTSPPLHKNLPVKD
jgi:uncharacterized protein (TIGR02757 family)